MADDIRALGGMYRDEIEARLEEIRREQKRVGDIVCGNGRAGLEEKIMAQVITLLKHQKANTEQVDTDLDEMIREEKAERLEQHKENLIIQKEHTSSLVRLERFAYCAGAIFMVFKFFGVENILKMIRP